jgi:transposase
MTNQGRGSALGGELEIKDIQKCNIHRRFAKPKLRKLKRIAIDEISIGKGHQYLTIVLDLSTGAVETARVVMFWSPFGRD